MAFFPELDRRDALLTLGALGLFQASGCGGASETGAASPVPSNTASTDTGTPPPADTGTVDTGTAATDAAPDTTYPTPGCMETADNIEGPYYRAMAPFRTDLRMGITTGVLLTLRGRVYGVGCKVPLTDAIVDIWQADADGHYDNDGTLMVPPSDYRLRGQQKVSTDASYECKTVIPGHYLNGSQYRPAHIHVKVSAPGYKLLTTQLYFDGDPYNGIDPFIKKPLIMKLVDMGSEKIATFDFVLASV